MNRLAAIALVAALALPAGAAAQSSPFAPLPQAPTPTVEQTPVNRTLENDGLESWQQILILVAAIVLIGGIGWAIVRDAHHRAPVASRPVPGSPEDLLSNQGEKLSATGGHLLLGGLQSPQALFEKRRPLVGRQEREVVDRQVDRMALVEAGDRGLPEQLTERRATGVGDAIDHARRAPALLLHADLSDETLLHQPAQRVIDRAVADVRPFPQPPLSGMFLGR